MAPKPNSRDAPQGGHSDLAKVETFGAVTLEMPSGDVYEGTVVDGKPDGRGTMTYKNGRLYDGDWENGERHGEGTMKYENGDVYEGGLKSGKPHGTGAYKFADGDGYVGGWKNGGCHGKGTMKYVDGSEYSGEWKADMRHGIGTFKWSDGELYTGDYVEGKRHGSGTMKYADGAFYTGDYVEGKRHGTGTYKWADGTLYIGEYANDKKNGSGVLTEPSGVKYAQKWEHGELLFSKRMVVLTDGPPVGVRKLRSQRSQQQRLHRDRMACERCGVGDHHYKLLVCSGCNLALYCSAACQEAANGAHRRICDIASMLPQRNADRLLLEYDREKLVDFDAGLRYATKYMGDLQHLEMNLQQMSVGDPVKLSAKKLTSLLTTKSGTLVSVILPSLRIDWSSKHCRTLVAHAVSSCSGLMKLDLAQCVFLSSEVEILLSGLSNLQSLNLDHCEDSDFQGFTDSTCEILARSCPGLRELSVNNHNELSAGGLQTIFEGCGNLRVFSTTTGKLKWRGLKSLLDVAPQLLCFSLDDANTIPDSDLARVTEYSGGRTLIRFIAFGIWEPDKGLLSRKARQNYEQKKLAFSAITDERGRLLFEE